MTPTTKLRFVERFEVTHRNSLGFASGHTVRILQQWWDKDIANQYTSVIAGDPSGEWRDVPIENEQT